MVSNHSAGKSQTSYSSDNRADLHVWSEGDKALLEKATRETGRYVDAEYRFEILHDVSHWIPDECPDTVASLFNTWLPAHPAAVS